MLLNEVAITHPVMKVPVMARYSLNRLWGNIRLYRYSWENLMKAIAKEYRISSAILASIESVLHVIAYLEHERLTTAKA